MATEQLYMKVGNNLGNVLLEICQTNISKGNIEKALNVYLKGLHGFTMEHLLMLLKNQAVLVTDEDGTGVNLVDDIELLKENEHNIFDWKYIINKRFENICGICENLIKTETEFVKNYHGSILDYDMLELMKRYYNEEEMKTMSGTANIAARICGDAECKICDKGNSNPWSVWQKVEGRVENYLADPEGYDYDRPARWEIVLYLTVKYNKLIRMLHKEYLNFENTYLFLVENNFIEKPNKIEYFIENTLKTLFEFTDTSNGYYHPLCNTGLYDYKTHLLDDLCHTYYGKEYGRYKIIKKDILDGYDAGWLSPDGDFYGGDGETSAMIHMNIADRIFSGTGSIADAMYKDGVSEFGDNSADYWLEKHGWVKIHHNEIYGSFIGHLNEEPTSDYPYAYCPTDIQIKMICDYADKFCNGKIYTRPQIVKNTEPVSTYKLRQMDKIQLHKLFRI